MPTLRVNVTQKKGGRVTPAPDALVSGGPLIPIEIGPLDSHATILQKQGRTVPKVSGMALVDTGAARTAVKIEAAQKVQLPIRGRAQMASASHSNIEVPIFAGQFLVGDVININVSSGLMGVSLDGQSEVIALIGRDLLSQVILIYDGDAASFSISL